MIGCINNPKNATPTGGARSVQAFEILMKKERIFAKELNVNVAYHSKFMQGIVAEYSRLIDNIVPDTDRKYESGHATKISTVSAKDVSPGQLRLLIEVEPHSAMQKSIKDVLGMLGKSNHIGCSSVLYRNLSATRTAMQMAGDL